MLVLLDEETGRLGQEEQPNADDEGPGELNGNGDSVASTVVAVGGSVVNDGCEEEPLFDHLALMEQKASDVSLTMVMASW